MAEKDTRHLIRFHAGVGLKAAMLYSQLHTSDACLKITTTSKSDGILHVQLRIDPDSEETAVVKKVAHFTVDEHHHHFSGTEMRLSIPCPHSTTEVESAADTLALYFQSLRYTAPPFVGVQFNFDIGEISANIECQYGEKPIDRLVKDLNASADDIVYAIDEGECTSTSCVAMLLGDIKSGRQHDVEICLLRYANHAPLVNSEDLFLCGITKGINSSKVWKKYGLRCQRTKSYLVNQLTATPLRSCARSGTDDTDEPLRLVLAVDVCVAGFKNTNGIKYRTFKKSALDVCYGASIQCCCRSILQQLVDAGRLSTPQQQQEQELVQDFAPLIARSLAAIVKQSQASQSITEPSRNSQQDHFNEELIIQELQAALQHW
ncbi:hypothetical protein DVH05_014731 [Phytophthora capsici]|nr:hypothetical protein DVH05_014731 [Phytophthora capsici]